MTVPSLSRRIEQIGDIVVTLGEGVETQQVANQLRNTVPDYDAFDWRFRG